MNHTISSSLLAYYRSAPHKISLLRMLVVSGSRTACSRNSRAVIRDQMVNEALLSDRSTSWQCDNEFRTRVIVTCILYVKFLISNKLLINQVCDNVISVSSNIFM
jgi:hypothetical protein